MKRSVVLTIAAAALASAEQARADWKAANAEVTAAARDPAIAAVLEQARRMDAAIVAGDTDGFYAVFTPDARINSPFNNVATRDIARQRSASGALTYEYLHRSIEYAARRYNGEVLLMGEETFKAPPGNPFAGKTARRRVTEIWRKLDGRWKLDVRQATVFEAK